jgi:hypothetical protein
MSIVSFGGEIGAGTDSTTDVIRQTHARGSRLQGTFRVKKVPSAEQPVLAYDVVGYAWLEGGPGSLHSSCHHVTVRRASGIMTLSNRTSTSLYQGTCGEINLSLGVVVGTWL